MYALVSLCSRKIELYVATEEWRETGYDLYGSIFVQKFDIFINGLSFYRRGENNSKSCLFPNTDLVSYDVFSI